MTHPQRIGIITREWPTGRPECGGIGTYFWNLAEGLRQCGAEPVVITGPISRNTVEDLSSPFPMVHVPEPRMDFSRRVLHRVLHADRSYCLQIYEDVVRRRAGLKRHLWQIVREHQLDVLIGPLWSGETVDASTCTGLPVVLRASGHMRATLRANGDEPGRCARHVHELEQTALSKSSGIYAPCESALRDLLACMISPPVPARVIPSGVNTEFFRPADPPVHRDTCRLLFVARQEPQKGMQLLTDVLPELLNRFEHLEVWIVGRDTPSAPGDVSWQAYWESTWSESCFDRCHFMGRIPWPRLARIYPQCDALLVPSVSDHLPNTALEAMACGIPVVASMNAGLEGAIQNLENGMLVREQAPDAWIATLSKLVQESTQLRSMGDQARRRIEKDFSVGQAARGVLDLCQHAVENHAEMRSGAAERDCARTA